MPEHALLIRRAGPADADAVRSLTRAAYAKWVPLIGREPRPMQADHARAVREHRVDLMIEHGALVALVEIIEQPDDLLIENLAVHPEHQGRGLGSRLLDHAARVACARATPVLRLYTNALFAENLSLYARRGFVVEREETLPIGRVIHMIKTLPTP